ncbi:MAG TPA: thioredoxin family protein [Chthoniobacteraceae bacterium]|nr:thioredoxin family protein [Chthoniobacteraceae bacterium]
MKTKLSILALLIASCAAWAAVDINKKAPDFSLTDTKGKTVTLSQFKGKFVVLEWTNPDCPIVHKHYDSGNMQKLQKEYTGKGVIWLAIDSSAAGNQGNYPPAQLEQIMKTRGASPTDILTDYSGTVGHEYGAKNTPQMFIINPAGDLIYDGAIDSIESADQSDIPKATNYVRAALDEALAGKPVTTPSTRPYGCAVHY